MEGVKLFQNQRQGVQPGEEPGFFCVILQTQDQNQPGVYRQQLLANPEKAPSPAELLGSEQPVMGSIQVATGELVEKTHASAGEFP